MPRFKISRETCEEIAKRFQTNERRASIYADYPYDPVTIRNSLYRYGLMEPSGRGRGPNTRADWVEKIMPYKAQIENGSISKRELAKKIGMSYPYLCKVCLSLGIKSFYNYRQGVKTPRPGFADKYEEVLEHLIENGGTVNSSIRATGIKVDPHAVHMYAKGIGLNTDHYRYAHQRYGLWEILPGPFEKVYTADFRVTAVCTGCGNEHKVTMVNLRAGMSRGCISCATQGQRLYEVVCEETGETFTSIRRFIEEKFGLDNYRVLRPKLMRGGELVVDGNIFKLLKIDEDNI